MPPISMSQSIQQSEPSLLVVGAGIVGLSCAWRAQRDGWQVTVVDPDFAGDRASHGNAGSIAVAESTPVSIPGINLQVIRWLVDPLGPLAIRWRYAPRLLSWFMAFRKVNLRRRPAAYLRICEALAAINNRVYDDLVPMLDDLGIGEQLHRGGALVVYESEATFQAGAAEWALRRQLGVRWRELDADEICRLEPGLAPVFARGILLEDCAHVDDPKAIVAALRTRIVALGGTLTTARIDRLDLSDPLRPAAVDDSGRRHAADRLLVAAGAWSGRLGATVGDRMLVESERGYNTTLPATMGKLQREVVFADRKFVATPLSIGLRVGGTAEFGGLEATPDYRRSAALMTLARRYFPVLDEAGAQQWAGHRPATPDSLPVIGVSPHSPHLTYAFGHGHLGLTQAATTATLVADLLADRPGKIDMAPYVVTRF